jgi:hypothetical protein
VPQKDAGKTGILRQGFKAFFNYTLTHLVCQEEKLFLVTVGGKGPLFMRQLNHTSQRHVMVIAPLDFDQNLLQWLCAIWGLFVKRKEIVIF